MAKKCIKRCARPSFDRETGQRLRAPRTYWVQRRAESTRHTTATKYQHCMYKFNHVTANSGDSRKDYRNKSFSYAKQWVFHRKKEFTKSKCGATMFEGETKEDGGEQEISIVNRVGLRSHSTSGWRL